MWINIFIGIILLSGPWARVLGKMHFQVFSKLTFVLEAGDGLSDSEDSDDDDDGLHDSLDIDDDNDGVIDIGKYKE